MVISIDLSVVDNLSSQKVIWANNFIGKLLSRPGTRVVLFQPSFDCVSFVCVYESRVPTRRITGVSIGGKNWTRHEIFGDWTQIFVGGSFVLLVLWHLCPFE